MKGIYLIMGVSGCGKSSVGIALAKALNLEFFDADDYHPEANIQKMQEGIPLQDEDRYPWLKILNLLIKGKENDGLILACSALKSEYRRLLEFDLKKKVYWIFLSGSKELIFERINQRSGHFMPIDLLNSQFEALEFPKEAIEIDIQPNVDQIVENILKSIQELSMTENDMADIGLIGLGVMGSNIALNLNSRDLKVAVYNKQLPGEASLLDRFMDEHRDKGFIANQDLELFVNSLSRPRKIFVMILAGYPIDEMINALIPLLEKGDTIIDGGNSFFEDSIRRERLLKSKGLHFVGTGVSGGAEGALKGPSIMAGGSEEAKVQVLPILKKIAALTTQGKSCAAWVGPDGAGHFSKMVHNGIEYADMQIISEVYEIMRTKLKMSNKEMSKQFKIWNKSNLKSYLIEITASILSFKNKEGFPIDQILDVAGHKGTGLWTIHEALKVGIAVPTIYAAVNQRLISRHKEERVAAEEQFAKPNDEQNKEEVLSQLGGALLLARISAYAQGFHLLKEASDKYNWDLKMKKLAGIWRAGCIIRSSLLEDIRTAFKDNEALDHLFNDPAINETCSVNLENLIDIVVLGGRNGIALPALSSALQYFYSWHTAELPINLIQAQRDFFGAHCYHKKDDNSGILHHTNWEER